MDLLELKAEVLSWEEILNQKSNKLKVLKNNMLKSKLIEQPLKIKMKSVINALDYRIVKICSRMQDYRNVIFTTDDYKTLEKRRNELEDLYSSCLEQIENIMKALPKKLTDSFKPTLQSERKLKSPKNMSPSTKNKTAIFKIDSGSSLEKVKDPVLSSVKKQKKRQQSATQKNKQYKEQIEILSSRPQNNTQNTQVQKQINSIRQETKYMKSDVLELQQSSESLNTQVSTLLKRVNSIEVKSQKIQEMIKKVINIEQPDTKPKSRGDLIYQQIVANSNNEQVFNFLNRLLEPKKYW